MKNQKNYESIVKKALQGDENAYAELYTNSYSGAIYLAKKLIDNEQDALDIVQVSFIKAFKNLYTLKRPEYFKVWFNRIVTNTAINHLKKQGKLNFSSLADAQIDKADNLEEETVQNRPERLLERKETSRIVNGLIQQLPNEQRLVVFMYYYSHMKVKQIASDLGCSENTVKSQLYYARKNIQKMVEKQGYDLFGLTPIAFFNWVLQQDKGYAAVPATQIQHQYQKIAHRLDMGTNITQAASNTVFQQVVATVAGHKAIVAVAAVIITGGIATAVAVNNAGNKIEPPQSNSVAIVEQDSANSQTAGQSSPAGSLAGAVSNPSASSGNNTTSSQSTPSPDISLPAGQAAGDAFNADDLEGEALKVVNEILHKYKTGVYPVPYSEYLKYSYEMGQAGLYAVPPVPLPESFTLEQATYISIGNNYHYDYDVDYYSVQMGFPLADDYSIQFNFVLLPPEAVGLFKSPPPSVRLHDMRHTMEYNKFQAQTVSGVLFDEIMGDRLEKYAITFLDDSRSYSNFATIRLSINEKVVKIDFVFSIAERETIYFSVGVNNRLTLIQGEWREGIPYPASEMVERCQEVYDKACIAWQQAGVDALQ